MTAFRYRCPACKRSLKVRLELAGRQVRCPNEACQQQIQLPSQAQIEAATAGKETAPQNETPKKKREAPDRSIGSRNPSLKQGTCKKPRRPKPDGGSGQQRTPREKKPNVATLVIGFMGILLVVAMISSALNPNGGGSALDPLPVVATAAAAEPQPADPRIMEFFKQHCIDCHGPDMQEGNVRLDTFDQNTDVLENFEMWHRVYRQVSLGSMPPSDMPAPPQEERDLVSNWFDQELNHFECIGVPRAGHVTVHRLNRVEYDNTIRDLLGLDLNLSSNFPVDDSGYGFDNNGDVLTTSALLLEKYLQAAETASEAAIILPETLAVDRTWKGKEFRIQGSGSADTSMAVFPSNGKALAKFDVKVAGPYQFAVIVSGTQAGDVPAKCELFLDGKSLAIHDVPGHRKTRDVQWNMDLTQGSHELIIAFINDHYDPDAADPQMRDRNLFVHSARVSGPGEVPLSAFPASHRKIITKDPATFASPQDAAKTFLKPLLDRAFRRPATDQQLARFERVFQIAHERSQSFEQGMQIALQAILVSPEFLFRIEQSNQPTGQLDDYELASRLSYFLWSSMPDEELFELARARKLNRTETIQQQVERMMTDEKSSGLISNFVSQWLGLNKLDKATPDPDLFPVFNKELAGAMRTETELLFEHVLDNNLSIMELLTADYTFANESLASHYGIKDVQGPEFRQVKLSETPRRGLLSHAGILTLTSFPNRTSPVKRGEWVLENILAQAPPPPPPTAPSLEETQVANPNLSFREQLILHQKDPICSSCHKLMDGIGFGLQNFDAVGRWRETEGTHPIDARGDLPDGTSFNGPQELITILSRRPDEFTRCMAEKMLTYSLGRGLEWYDRCTIDDVIAGTRENHYRLRQLIVEIALSSSFREQVFSSSEGTGR
ncbi:MAG: DUF1592 domain-containing protein [Planctomycetaceae bacterium]|nr:DUF1592 domain-containing protein [Planctomycetaceae bacterium]